MKRKIELSLIALCMFLGLVSQPMECCSEEVETYVQILPFTPNLGEVRLTDLDGNVVGDVDVAREYLVSFDLLDKNGIYDISSVHVRIYYAGSGGLIPSSPDKRCSYEVVWENNGSSGTWQSYPAGYLGAHTSFKKLSPCLFEYCFPFVLDKVSVPSGSENTWRVEVRVEDSSGLECTYDDLFFDVNDYIEWTGVPSQINLSSIDSEPESPWTLDSPISILTCITSNTQVNVNFKANALEFNDIMIDPCSYFTICAGVCPIGGSIVGGYEDEKPVSSELTSIYQGVFSSSCTLNPSVDGYIDCQNGLVSFAIDLQAGKQVPYVPAGTYLSSWTFSIERGSGITL